MSPKTGSGLLLKRDDPHIFSLSISKNIFNYPFEKIEINQQKPFKGIY